MSAFYDLASLVLVPSGYKTSKVYAQKPLTTDGQLAFTRASTATRVNSAGLIETVALNVPRLDYLGGGCPKLLLEPQRTNLITFSEQLNNAAWANAGGTTTANTAISPSGFQDADTLTGARFQSVFATSNTYTLSAFAKKVDGDGTFVLRIDEPATRVAVFNLNNGTIVSTFAGYTSTITNFGNGYFRCTLTTPASTPVTNAVIISANGGTSSTFVYGCQFELGSYATSYIPTLAAAVTRSADAASKTGISALIGQTEGTLYLEIDLKNVPITKSFIMLRNAGVTNYISLRIFSNNVRFQVVDSNVLQVSIDRATITAEHLKIALAYNLNDFAMFVNGVQIGVDTSGLVPTTDILDLNFNSPTENAFGIAQTLLFKTRLTNAQLAELTA